MHRSANAGHHVFSLSVHKIVAVKFLFAGAGITRKAHTGAGIFSCVSEDHLHYVDGGAKKPRDFLYATVGHSFLRHPRAEHGANRAPQLFDRILRKFLAALFLKVFLEFGDEILPSAGGNGRVFLNAQASLERVQPMFEILLRQTHHDSGIHLNKAAIGVIGKALVVYASCEPCNALVVKPEIQNRLHHAGHGAGGAGAHADQERCLGISELLLGDFFEPDNVLCNLLFELGRKLPAILVVVVARCSGDRKTTRDRQTDSGHLRQAGPFAS